MKKIYKCAVHKHSKKQLEIKLEYPLNKDKKISKFSLDLYYYFPSQLHVNEKKIGSTSFLNSMLINTRFSSPLMELEKVLDRKYDLSPLIRIEELLRNNKKLDSTLHNKLLYELQTLCNLYRAEVIGFVKTIKKGVKKDQDKEVYLEKINTMIQEMNSFLKRFRNIHSLFLNHKIKEDIIIALNWADESISIITGRNFINLFHIFENLDEGQSIVKNIKDVVDSEALYRRSMNYKYQYNKHNPICGETMAYRESVLKKWSQSAMYMNIENSNVPKQISHIIAGTAAGVAMVIALIVSMFAKNYLPQRSSLFIMALVVSYILKDRIKEVLKVSFGNMLPKLTTDQQSNLFDPALKKKVGTSSGTVSFGSTSSIPNNINNIRYSKPNPFRKILPGNNIIHYKRRIKIRSKVLKNNHSRLESITEIIRFQIDDWLKDMEDSKSDLWYLEKDKKIKINGGRVYRVHLIMALNKDKFYHYTLVINKSGLLRIVKENI